MPSLAEEIENLEYIKDFEWYYDLEKFKYPDGVVDLKIDKFNSIYIEPWAFKRVISENRV